MRVSRREVISAIALTPALAIFPGRASSQILETLAVAGATALVQGLATNLASRILPPKAYENDEIKQKLSEIAKKLDRLTQLVSALPDVLTERFRIELERDRISLLDAQKPQVDAIAVTVAQRRPPRPTPNEVAQLNGLVATVQTFTDSLWRYGPAIYPNATFGVMLAIVIHRLLGSDPMQVRSWVMDQVDRHFLPLTDAAVEGSFRRRADDNARRAIELATYLRAYPRTGLLAKTLLPSFRGGSPCIPLQGRVRPIAGLPGTEEKFRVREDFAPGSSAPPFPDFGYSNRCRSLGEVMSRPKEPARRLAAYLNGKLDEQRKAASLGIDFDLASNDVLGVAQVFQRIVDA